MAAATATILAGAALASSLFAGDRQLQAGREAKQDANGARLDANSAVAAQKARKIKETEAAAMSARARQAGADGSRSGAYNPAQNPVVDPKASTMLGSVGSSAPVFNGSAGSAANKTLLGT